MSRGLGGIQRRLIEVGNATRTIWDCGATLTVEVAHDAPLTVAGVTVEPTGERWRLDGKPWYCARAEVSDAATYHELRRQFRFVRFIVESSQARPMASILEPVANSLWSLSTIYATLFPSVFGVDLRELKTIDAGRSAYHRRFAHRMMVDNDVKRQRASAKATVSRALASLQRRGLVRTFCYAYGDIQAIRDRRGWRGRYGKYFKHNYDALYVVVDSAACI